MSSNPPQTTKQLPNIVRISIQDFIQAVRNQNPKKRTSKCRKRSRTNGRSPAQSSWYEQAKNAQTVQRDLEKALQFYLRSAQQGDRIDSCIKDFASILHQMGHTKEAVELLEQLKKFYKGDMKKLNRLMLTLTRQIVPSAKHQIRTLLFELPNRQKVTFELMDSWFENPSRIRKLTVMNHLAYRQQGQEEGKWLFVQFDSFSAAKKTLEKFRFQEWFGINKYWLTGKQISCEATDGREDFEKGFVVTQRLLRENLSLYYNQVQRILLTEDQQTDYQNKIAIYLINNQVAKTVIVQPEPEPEF